MQHYMVEHGTKGVLGIVGLGRQLHRFTDGDAETARVIGVLRQYGAAGVGEIGRGGDALGPVGAHQCLPIGLLLIGHLDLEYLHLETEQAAGERQGRAPLAGAGFGGQTAGAGFRIVIGLGHGGVRLVRAGRAHALVFEVDARRRIQRLFQAAGTDQRAWAPHLVDVQHRCRNIHITLGGHFLGDQGIREQGRQVRRGHRLTGAGMQHRGHRFREVRHDVVPLAWQTGLLQEILGGVGHGALFF